MTYWCDANYDAESAQDFLAESFPSPGGIKKAAAALAAAVIHWQQGM